MQVIEETNIVTETDDVDDVLQVTDKKNGPADSTFVVN